MRTLEKIRFSITRLKQIANSLSIPYHLPWKDKILDYEIETLEHVPSDAAARKTAWKDKILDYEIETLG